MKSLLVLEHPQHLPLMRGHYNQGDVFLGLTPQAAFELESQGVPFKIPENYYSHNDFFSLYKDSTENLLDIIIRLDDHLWEIDPRFKENSIKPFFLDIFLFKMLIDTIKIYIYFLENIIEQESIEQVIIVSSETYGDSEEDFLGFNPQDPVLWMAIEKLAGKYNIKTKRISPEEGGSEYSEKRISVEKAKTEIAKSKWWKGFKHWKSSSFIPGFLQKTGKSSGKILSFACSDLADLKNDLVKKGHIIENFPELDFINSIKPMEFAHYDELKDIIRNDKELKNLFTFESVNFYNILEKKLFEYLANLEVFYLQYQWISRFMDKKDYSLVVLNTVTPFHKGSVMIADISRKKNTPFICWMHGGYGAYKTFEGYDMADLLIGDHYFTYGESVKNAIDEFHPRDTIGIDAFRKAEGHYPVKKVKTHVTGTPSMESQLLNIGMPENPRKKILFIMGELWFHNQYYMGGNTPYTYFLKWNETQAIVRTLIPFQKDYEIILKTYPNPLDHRKDMLKRFLKEIGGQDIKVIGGESPIQSLLKKSDLTISTWVSTTFFHSALTHCDQFLFDDGDLTEEARGIIEKTCFFSDDIEKFCHILEDYLKKGEFYQKSKDEFRKHFLDSDNSSHRLDRIDNLLNEIIQSNK